jgi:hypothetical protein
MAARAPSLPARLGVDVDEVLASTTPPWADRTKPYYPGPGFCFVQTSLNQMWYARSETGCKLRVVIGSLGLGRSLAEAHFEYGGARWGAAEFEEGRRNGAVASGVAVVAHMWDAHAWLEDDKGNVYDCVYERWAEIALIWRRAPFRGKPGPVEAVPRAALAKRGLHYVPAPADVQVRIREDMRRRVNAAVRAVLSDA